MDISFENLGGSCGKLTIKMEKNDYAERVENALKSFRKKSNLPGFRPGQAPISILKQRFGKEITAEEVNKLLGEKLYSYIKENKIEMLGEPLGSEDQPELDIEADELTFVFDIILQPEFTVEATSADTVPYYTIEVTDQMVDERVKAAQRQGGSYDQVDSFEAEDMLKGQLVELDEEGNEKEGGIVVENAVMLPKTFKSEDEKAKFAGAQKDASVVFNPTTAYAGSEIELSTLMKIEKDQVAQHAGNFKYTIVEITRYTPSELNQELFDAILGKDVVKSEEEFRANLKEQIQKQLAPESDYKFMIDLRAVLEGKVGTLQFPDALVKRFLKDHKETLTDEDIEKNYDEEIKQLTWLLIKNKLVKTFQIQINDDDVLKVAKRQVSVMLAQYGMMGLPEDVVTNYAKNIINDEKRRQQIVDQAIDVKLSETLKGVVTLDNKTVSVEDFNKMFQEQA